MDDGRPAIEVELIAAEGGDVARVELGRPRRRWWPVAAAVVAAWVVVAVLVGGGDPEPAAVEPTTTTDDRSPSTTLPPARPRPSTTTTASTILEGAPLVGRATGWRLLAFSGSPGRSRVVDLDTGLSTAVELRALLGVGAGGVFVEGNGGVQWVADPLDDASVVDLGDSWQIVPVAGTDRAWLSVPTPDRSSVSEVVLVRVTDGTELARLPVPPSGWVVGEAAGRLVLAGGGDTFVVDPAGAIEPLDGQPIAASGDHVYLSVCDDDLTCSTEAHDVRTGGVTTIEGLGQAAWYGAASARPGGGFIAASQSPQGTEQSLLVLPTGTRPVLPDGLIGVAQYQSAWSPDGSLLFVPSRVGIHVIDPFADGGPVEVTRIDLPSNGDVQLAVLGSP